MIKFRAFLCRLGLAFATGYIWFFYSERVFWSFWRPGVDTFASFVATLLVYAVAAYICLICIQEFHVRSVWAVFMIGALFGWLIEGVFAMTFFGAGGIPFPFTISWTALAWHAILSVILGWFFLQQALLHSVKRTALLSLALGVFWGVWGVSWVAAGAVMPASLFFTHALLVTFVLISIQRAYYSLGISQFRASMTEKIILAFMVFGWFCFVTFATVSVFALALPVLFILLYFVLRKNKKMETGSFLETLDARIPWKHSLIVLLMPLSATVVFGAIGAVPTNMPIFALTCLAGFVFFAFGIWKIVRRK